MAGVHQMLLAAGSSLDPYLGSTYPTIGNFLQEERNDFLGFYYGVEGGMLDSDTSRVKAYNAEDFNNVRSEIVIGSTGTVFLQGYISGSVFASSSVTNSTRWLIVGAPTNIGANYEVRFTQQSGSLSGVTVNNDASSWTSLSTNKKVQISASIPSGGAAWYREGVYLVEIRPVSKPSQILSFDTRLELQKVFTGS